MTKHKPITCNTGWKMFRFALICILLIAPTSVRAQTNPSTNLAIGLGATLAPAGTGLAMWVADGSDPSAAAMLIATGVIVGPSVGYWSAGLTGRGWRGLGIRTGVAVLAFVPAFGICGWNCSVDDDSYDLAWAVIATGAGVGLFSAVHDLSSMKSNIRQHRDRRNDRDAILIPIYDPANRAVGVRASLPF